MQYNFRWNSNSSLGNDSQEGMTNAEHLELHMGELSPRQRFTLVSLTKRMSDSVTSRQLPVSGEPPARIADESGC